LGLRFVKVVWQSSGAMPRPPRIEYENAVYHVTSRGNGRQSIFWSDNDRERFVEQLKDNLKTYGVDLYAYVLMLNHYHLLVCTPYGNLSRFMQRLNTSYALYFRYKNRKVGHVLQGRYKAKLVESGEYAVRVSRYIHLNPIKTKKAGRLDEWDRRRYLEEYKWSSYHGYVRKKNQEKFVNYELLSCLDERRLIARRKYGSYIREKMMHDDERLKWLVGASCYAIGSEEYIAEVEEELQARLTGEELDRDVDLPRKRISLDMIDEVVCAALGGKGGDLRMHGSRAGKAKQVALELACCLSGLTQRQIGKYYGGITSMAVCMARRKVRQDKRLLGLVEELEQTIAQISPK
jgi:REP element-mobilizing transposase RayT